MNRAEKQRRVDQLRDELVGATGVVVAGYNELTVEDITELRTELRKSGGTIRVVKNTLARLSVKGTEHEGVTDFLTGANLFAFGVDPVAPAKVLSKASKGGDKVTVKGGVLNGKPLSAAEVEALSKLPSLDELRAKFLGVMNQVPQKFVMQLAAPARSLVTVLSAQKDKLEEGA